MAGGCLLECSAHSFCVSFRRNTGCADLGAGCHFDRMEQMIDRICVKVQDHLNSLRNCAGDAVQEDLKSAERLMRDAKNSKTVSGTSGYVRNLYNKKVCFNFDFRNQFHLLLIFLPDFEVINKGQSGRSSALLPLCDSPESPAIDTQNKKLSRIKSAIKP